MWLQTQRHLRVLHVFDSACNLIDANDDVMSLVTPQVGNGPFNLVVPQICFGDVVAADSPATYYQDRLTIGDLEIDTASAATWNPCPSWEMLRGDIDLFYHALPLLLDVLQTASPVDSFAGLIVDLPAGHSMMQAEMYRTAKIAADTLMRGLLSSERSLCLEGTYGLVGLGGGLTPSGDDWLMGCLLAVQIVSSPQVRSLMQSVVEVAVKRTTPLSAAWLRAAGRGECGAIWHSLFAAIHTKNDAVIRSSAEVIIQTGHTSGSDALTGFVTILDRQ
jgi:hypothetical protein